jgi:tetratricopeptide (TPR) repeat protein
MGLEKYFQLEGLTYRVVPKLNTTNSPYSAPPRTDVMYNNMMTKFKFGGITEDPNVNLDENILRMTVNIRGNYGRLAEALLAQGEKEKAAGVIDYSLKMMPADRVQHSVFDYSYPGIYYQADQKEKGRKLLDEMMRKAENELDYWKGAYEYALNEARDDGDATYYAQLQQGAFMEKREVREELYIMQELLQTVKRFDPDHSKQVEDAFDKYRKSFIKIPMNQ